MRGLISVIVPVYNVEAYLEQCLNSIARQTYTNLEIILVDDGSPDGCGEICDRWVEKDPRFSVIHTENGGLSRARNVGMEKANGEYIAFVDSDDYVHEELYSHLVAAIEESQADIAVCREYAFDDEKEPEYMKYSEPVIEIIENRDQVLEHFMSPFTGVIGWAWNKLYRREVIGDIIFAPGKKMEDIMFNAEVFVRANKVVWIDERLYYYRQRQGSLCGNGRNEYAVDLMEAMRHVTDFFTKKLPDTFYQRYSIYLLEKEAWTYIAARKDKHPVQETVWKMFKEDYSRYYNFATGVGVKVKLWMARYMRSMYYLLKCRSV